MSGSCNKLSNHELFLLLFKFLQKRQENTFEIDFKNQD